MSGMRWFRVVAIGCLVLALAVVVPVCAAAAEGGNNPPASENGQTPGGATSPLSNLKMPQVPNQNLTPEQWQMMMQMRMLQSRGGGRGVRTGYPQFIPLGMPAMTPYPQGNWAGNQAVAPGNPSAAAGNENAEAHPAAPEQAGAARKSSKERRAEARKAAEEKKRAAREAREAKIKEKAAKAKEAKAARLGKKDAADAKDDNQ
jgi:hypothetical protein